MIKIIIGIFIIGTGMLSYFKGQIARRAEIKKEEAQEVYVIAHYQRTVEIATQFLMENEGFRATPYFCPGGKKTIGYGDTLIFNDQPDLERVSRDFAEIRLNSMITDIYNRIPNKMKYRYTPEQTAAIIALIYRVGFTGLIESRLFYYLSMSQPNMKIIEKEWLEFQMVKNKKILSKRAEREFSLFYYGEMIV